MPDATLPRLIRPTKSERWTDQAFTLRPAQVFPCLFATDAYALTLIDPMLPLFARPPWTGFFLAG